jgi:hypothetical protein
VCHGGAFCCAQQKICLLHAGMLMLQQTIFHRNALLIKELQNRAGFINHEEL